MSDHKVFVRMIMVLQAVSINTFISVVNGEVSNKSLTQSKQHSYKMQKALRTADSKILNAQNHKEAVLKALHSV